MSYFNQVLLHDFTPLSSSLVLSKILIVFDEVSPGENSDSDEEEGMQQATQVLDYSTMTRDLFFRVFEGPTHEESRIFDQLDLHMRIDSSLGLPEQPIGVPIVTVNAKVVNDFRIVCMRNDFVEQ